MQLKVNVNKRKVARQLKTVLPPQTDEGTVDEAKFKSVTPEKADEDVQPATSHTSSKGVSQNSAHVVAISRVEFTTRLDQTPV